MGFTSGFKGLTKVILRCTVSQSSRNNKLSYTFSSYCVIFVNYIMMHGTLNINWSKAVLVSLSNFKVL